MIGALAGKVSQVTVTNCDELTSFAALSNITGVKSLSIFHNEKLESVPELQMAPEGRLILQDNPQLSSIAVLLPPYLTTIAIEGSDLTNLDALSPLIGAKQVAIIDNPRLKEMNGLSNIGELESLFVINNPEIEELPEFEKLYTLQRLTVRENNKLVSLPEFTGLIAGAGPSSDTLGYAEVSVFVPEPQLEVLEIEDNSELLEFWLPEVWWKARHISIARNERLSSLDLNQLTSLDYLSISANPSLNSVNANSLASVDMLEVINNENLSTASFDSVLTFSRDLRNNAAD